MYHGVFIVQNLLQVRRITAVIECINKQRRARSNERIGAGQFHLQEGEPVHELDIKLRTLQRQCKEVKRKRSDVLGRRGL